MNTDIQVNHGQWILTGPQMTFKEKRAFESTFHLGIHSKSLSLGSDVLTNAIMGLHNTIIFHANMSGKMVTRSKSASELSAIPCI